MKRQTINKKHSSNTRGVYLETKKTQRMKYYVTYSITHPEHTPTTATGMVEARSRPGKRCRKVEETGLCR